MAVETESPIPPPATTDQPRVAGEGIEAAKPRVLMLTHRLPYPPDRGDRIRSYHMLKELARHFEVAIGCTSDEPVWLQHHQLLSTIAKRVGIQPISNNASKLKAFTACATGQAITPHYYYRQGLADTITQWHEEAPFDVVLTFCTGMIRYARLIVPTLAGKGAGAHRNGHTGSPKPIRHVLDLVDVDSLKWRSYARQTWPPLRWVYGAEARRLRRIESGAFDRLDAITVVSEAEAQAYRDEVGDHPGLTVVGNGVDLEYFAPLPDADSPTLVFVGVLNYKPNVEGLAWFVANVFAKLRSRLPDAKLMVVGRHPTPRVEQMGEQPGVEVVGSVSDVRVYLRQASAVIAPLRIARGVQNKVLEAMASSRAVVCSHQAAEGIHASDGQHLLVADQPDQWVGQIERLVTDQGLRRRIAEAARQHVAEHYSWSKRLEPMVDLLRTPPPVSSDQPPLGEAI